MKHAATHDYECIAMACQGGGSLGAYHIGSLEAMQEAGYEPDVVAGISIGAFTAAIIAGNKPHNRAQMLKQFWDTISWPDFPPLADELGLLKRWHNMLSSLQGFVFGQPGFFKPWQLPQMFYPSGTPGATSYYDTSLLLQTLPQVVDFDLINASTTRLILGTTRVRDGKPRWFDSQEDEIGPEHVIASGAMPPGFPGVRINNELYWDGGCYSNTPLDGIYDRLRGRDTLCFVINLFGPNGREPENIAEVNLMIKEIQFSNRMTRRILQLAEHHNMIQLLRQLRQEHPEMLKGNPLLAELDQKPTRGRFDIVQILYQKPSSEVPTCDCEFSKASIQSRMLQGCRDMRKALDEKKQLDADQATARQMVQVASVVNTFGRGGSLVKTSFHPAQALLQRTAPKRAVPVVKGTGRAKGVELRGNHRNRGLPKAPVSN